MYDDRRLNEAIAATLESLDITPTMFNEAESHYKAVADFLCGNGADYDVSPFGSIATGTVIRPYAFDRDSYFDFDVLCKRNDLEKAGCGPEDVRKPVEDALLSSDRYKEMTEASDICLTIEYVQNGRKGGFRLDLNPCVANEGCEPEISDCETCPRYSSDTVSIARRNPDAWLGSNPQGLIDWFNDKNERFATISRAAQRAAIFKNAAGAYASIEEIPRELERTSLQRAIQFVKRSRDVHYCHFGGAGKKPPSCMLMVLVVKAAEELPDNASTIDIIRAFAKSMLQARADASDGEETAIGSPGNWRLENPVYGGSLLDDDWTDRDSADLFHWVKVLVGDLEKLAFGGIKSKEAARALFGKGADATALDALPPTEAHAAPSVIATGRKPWRPFAK